MQLIKHVSKSSMSSLSTSLSTLSSLTSSLFQPLIPSVAIDRIVNTVPSALCISYLLVNVIHKIQSRRKGSLSTMVIVNMVMIILILYIEMKTMKDFTQITKGNNINIDNKNIHYINKIIRNNSSSATSLAYFHGFGSNSMSFKPIIDQLMHRNRVDTNYYITGHDTPGFGFGQRDRMSLQSVFYRPLWNANTGNNIMKMFYENNKSNETRCNTIIFAHSFGSIPALLAGMLATHDNKNVTIVLECPALKYVSIQESEVRNTNETIIMMKIIDKVSNLKPLTSKLSISELLRGMVLRVLLGPLRLIIQALLRSRYFWKNGLAVAYTKNINEISNEIFDNYRLAAYGRDFDIDLFKFVRAQSKGSDNETADNIGCPFPSNKVLPDITHLDLLLALCKLHTKVIIIHSSNDKVVPLQISIDIVNEIKKRLSDDEKQYIDLRILNNRGHVPHEEDVTGFLNIINDVI